MLPRVKEPASPVELMLLNCSARCQMSYAGLVARCSGACRDLAWRCHLFIMLSTLGVERLAYATHLAIRTQALSPHAMRRGPSLPEWLDVYLSKIGTCLLLSDQTSRWWHVTFWGGPITLRCWKYTPLQKQVFESGHIHFQNKGYSWSVATT